MSNHTIAGPAPWKLGFRSSKHFITWVVAIAVFTDVFIYGMIIPILPDMLRTRASIPKTEQQKWISILLAAFGGAIFIASPIIGYFADRSPSRQTPFLVGLFALGGSTVMFWFARVISVLVIARTLQGLSAAVVWTIGLALIVDTLGKAQAGAAMGIVSMAMTAGTLFGPFIGGIVLSKAGYHAVFSIAIALIILDIILRLAMIDRKTAQRWISAEAGADEETERLLGSQAMPGSSWHSEVARNSNAHPGHDGAHPAGEPAANIAQPKGPISQSQKKVVPGIVRLVCSGTLLVDLQATVVEAIVYSAFDTVLPLYAMKTFNMSSMGVGLCFIPLFAPSLLSTVIGAAVDRYGARQVAILGFVIDIPTFLILRLVTENTTRDKIILVVLLFFTGLAGSLKVVSLMVEVSRVVHQKENKCPGIFGEQGGTAQAYGLFNVAWSGGQVIGPLMAGFLVDQYGWATMASVLSAISGGTALILGISAPAMLRQAS
ncbi:major facilitator superfamily domain-containing protein [Aspergillus falconensis]